MSVSFFGETLNSNPARALPDAYLGTRASALITFRLQCLVSKPYIPPT